MPSGIQRNDSRALGPEGSDDWEKRALEHMGGAIWSSLEQFGWDHLGSPGISEGHQDSGSWGQLGDPRRLPLCFVVLVLALLLSVFCPPEVPSFFFLTETTGGHKAGGLAPVCQPRLHSSSCWGYGMSPDRQHTIHTHTYTCTHTFSHTLAVSIKIPRCRHPAQCIIHPFCQSLSLPVFQPSTAAASTLATLLLACPARFQGSSCQAARLGPLIVVPSFLLIPAGLLDTVGTNPSAAAVVPRSSTRIGYVRYGAGLYTHPPTHAHVQLPLQVAFSTLDPDEPE